MITVTDKTPNVPAIINEDYEGFFNQEYLKFLVSNTWTDKECRFKSELQLHNIPGDIDNLIEYLRTQHENCLRTFEQSGLCANIWKKSFITTENRFDVLTFIKKLSIVSDGNIDSVDLYAFFIYYTLNRVIENVLKQALILQKAQYRGAFNVFINNGEVSFGKSEDKKSTSEDQEEIILKNLIFNNRLFDTNARLLKLREIIAHSINMRDYNVMFGEPNPFTIDPEVQNEWYYVMKAIEDAEVAKRFSVPSFIDQMIEWYPWLFNFETPNDMKAFKRNMSKSISHEKGIWKFGKAKEVTKLKDMWAKYQSTCIDYAKLERMYNATYTGLCVKLQTLKAEIEKEKAKH